MATLCLPATAQTWVLHNLWSGPDDDRGTGNEIVDIEFRDNHQVFYGKGDRLYKWDFQAGRAHWFDFGGDPVDQVEVPRIDSSVVLYSVGRHRGRLYIRDADDLSELVSRKYGSEFSYMMSLDVDAHGLYAIAQTDWSWQGTGFQWGAGYEVIVYDIWGAGGWQIEEHDSRDRDGNNPSGDMLLHPTYAGEHSRPRWYRVWTPDSRERFREYTDSWGNKTDTYITSTSDHLDRIAITSRYGSDNDRVRLAALDSDNLIHVWDYGGTHLFNLNYWADYSAHDDILEFTYNGELLVTAYDHDVRFWDMSQEALDHSFTADALDDDESIESLAFSDSGTLMALGSSKGTAYIYRWTGGNAPAAPAQKTETQPTALLSNYPNPFNPETWIPYQLSEAAEVTVTIHASDGKLVRTLELGQMPAGAYSDKDRAAYWDGQNEQGEPVASGVYFYTLTAGDFSATRKMVIRK